MTQRSFACSRELRAEREEAAVPWTKSPFREEQTSASGDAVGFTPLSRVDTIESTFSITNDVLLVHETEEVEWIDLVSY